MFLTALQYFTALMPITSYKEKKHCFMQKTTLILDKNQYKIALT